MTRPAPLELLGIAVKVGVAAAELITELRPAGRVDVASTKSSSTDVVTEIDTAVEDFIRDRILEDRPADAIVGEEREDWAGSSGVVWLVDPIDGTVNFVYGIPQYAVSLAAVADGETLAGFVINVVSGERWGAARGVGAWRSFGAERTQLGPAAPLAEGLAHALVATGFNYLPEVRARQARAVAELMPHVRDIRRFGSAALDLCALASGRFDAYVEQGLQPWDLAAGALICREAGLVVAGLDADGAVSEPSERLVMAAPKALAEEFFALVVACGF
ncbi:MAG TPA: inositol monophosphatase family protein [Aeromicrobium sp.]|nr:inositol monophosphatase family protein [Aeromicrobium sp.]